MDEIKHPIEKSLVEIFKNSNNMSAETLFKVGLCLPAGPYVTDDDVQYIVEQIKNAIK